MADFELAFEKMIKNEGGYKLHKVKGDTGGLTYAGISYNNFPNWIGWKKIDREDFDSELTKMVRQFYKINFWDQIRGDNINSQIIAENIFDFSVNTGIKAASRLVQHIVNVTADGIIGDKTIKALNDKIEDEKDEKIFILMYALSKVFRYKNICLHDKRRRNDEIVSNMKFILGWINRVEKGLN